VFTNCLVTIEFYFKFTTQLTVTSLYTPKR